ncbi:Teichoic acid translocation permease TagG, partial [Enterococcus faecium]
MIVLRHTFKECTMFTMFKTIGDQFANFKII